MAYACTLFAKYSAVLLFTFILFLYLYILIQSAANRTFYYPPNLKFYHKSQVTLLEKIAGYRAQQSEQEITCQFAGNNQSCTFELLNEYHQQCGYFSTKASWENITGGFPFAEVLSDTCVLPTIHDISVPAADLHVHVRKHNISHVVLFGDSQGKRYNFALRSLLRHAGFTCSTLKFEKEGFSFGLEYYIDDVDPSLFLPVNRTCKSCASMLNNCADSDGKSVLVEYVSMIMNSKSVMMANQSFCQSNNGSHPLCTATSQQEFVFKHYFNKGKYPELLLMITTFAHDRERAFAGINRGMRHLLQIIDSHVPATSSIIWYTTTPFHKSRMYKVLRNLVCENGYDVNQKIRVLNHLLFHILKPRLKPRNNKPSMYGFFDLYHLQSELNESWAQDWIHSQPSWYQYVLGYTFRMLAWS